MPIKSRSQARALYAKAARHEGGLTPAKVKEMAHATPGGIKSLPDRLKKKTRKKS